MTPRAVRVTLRGVRVLVTPLVLVFALTLMPLISVIAQTTPQLTLSPSSAVPGVSLIATGTGFPGGATGQLFWSDGTPIAGFGIDGTGAFALEMMVPDVAPGPYTLVARSDDGTTVAEATLTVEEVLPPVEPTVPEATLPPTAPPVEPTVAEPALAPATEEVLLPEPTVPEATLAPTPPPFYPILASGHSDSSPDAAVAYDNDLSTVWLTDPVAPADAWLTLDLGVTKPISAARWLLATAGTLPWLEIQLSEDGVTWASLVTLEGTTLPVGSWTEQPVNVWARYVRFQVPNPNGIAQLGGFAEIEIWPAADARPISAIVTPEPAPTEVVAPTVPPTPVLPMTETPAAPEGEAAPASPSATPGVATSMVAAALPGGDSLSLPLRAAFYYPWFPGAWDQQGVNPYTIYEPTRGYYDGGDPSVVSGHIADMQYGNIQVGIASWWGQGTREDARMPQLLSVAAATGFKWTVHYEDEGFGNPSVATLRADLEYLRDTYASDPSYLRIDGRFVVFVYGGVESCEMVDRWSRANETVNAFIVLKVFGGYTSCGNQPGGWYQYSPAVAVDSQGSYSYSISPGFHLYGQAERLPRDLARWQQNVRDMVASGADWQLVTTYNEWGEGTSVEGATAWASDSGFGHYLDVLHANGQGSLPTGPAPTATTAPTPTATTAPAPTNTGAPGNPLVLAPVADARVDAVSPSNNYGSETRLGADLQPVERSYLRFDVQGLSAKPGKAVLRLWVTDSTSTGPKLVSVANTTWSEGSITWNNQPATGSTIGDVGNASSGQWIEYDVTNAIAGNGLVSFALVADSTNGIDVASREAAAAQRPQLVITTGGGTVVPTPAPTQVSTPAPTQIPSPGPTGVPAGSGSTYGPAADAHVADANPDTNYGGVTILQSDMSPNIQPYLRFSVGALVAPVQTATLRVYVNNGTSNGPAVHTSSNVTWAETGITWSNKPVIGAAVTDTGSVPAGGWLEYDVTSVVTGPGAYTFVLVPQSSDGLYVNSREAALNTPQLVVSTGLTTGPTPTPVVPTPTPVVPTPVPSGETAVLLAAGDISTCANAGDEQTAKILDGQEGTIATLGDNVYESGTSQQFTDCYGPTWGRHKDRTKPAPGNHEYNTAGASGYFQYFGPAAGQGYYSYDLGAWHIVSLNSQIAMNSGSAQEVWLRADLAASPAQCTLAYWHEPLFSSGSSHGNSPETRPLFQALYEEGAEIVLNGHDHTYERFAPQTASGQADPVTGIREFVVGTGGRSLYSFGTIQPNSEARNSSSLGILKLTLSPTGYSWQFLPVAGASYSDSGSGDCHGAPGSAVTPAEGEQLSHVPAPFETTAMTIGGSRRQHVVGRRQVRQRHARRRSDVTARGKDCPVVERERRVCRAVPLLRWHARR